ncbi:hypothetical protein C8R42DRAFT_671005 [Lentinula raphanica]|nr:hypothetical protein C8R42DRAFT_671005 [Lentinula raphanica]
MFKTLLTPLRAKFNELSPLSPSANASHSGLLAAGGDDDENDSELAPEDFARDVLIELMRNSVENLKSAEEVGGRIEVLSEIKRIMDQEPQTKDVFRELDGFLVLLNVLSTVQHSNLSSNPDTSPSPPTRPSTGTTTLSIPTITIIEPPSESQKKVITCIRLVFILASTALSSHPQNTEYFKLCVGYDSFRSAIEGLVTSGTVRLREVCLGLLLGFALGDLNSEDADVEELVLHVDEGFPAELERKLVNAMIRRPEAVYLLWKFLITPTTTQSSASPLHPMSSYPASNFTITFPTLKLLDVLASSNHRNRAILSVGEVIRPLLVHYRTLCRDLQENRHAKGTGTEEMERTKKEKALTQKLLKKLLEMGASPAIARGLFQRVVTVKDVGDDSPADVKGEMKGSKSVGGVEGSNVTSEAKELTNLASPTQADPKTNLDIEIDTDILDLLRSSMKSRWVEHFSLTGRAGMSFQTPSPEKGYKSSKGVGVGLPPTGFTFMIWLWVETLPPAPLPGSNTPSSSPLFTARLSPSSYEEELISLRLTHNGKLELISAGNSNASSSTSESTRPARPVLSVQFTQARVLKKKWTHLTLVHYPGGGGSTGRVKGRDKSGLMSPSIRLFVDGALSDTIDWPYPANLDVKGPALSPSSVEYVLGDHRIINSPSSYREGKNVNAQDTNMDTMSWCIASSYLVALPLADDLPRFIHHLGPRYFGSFQDTEIARFLTYEAATSLNMFVFNAGALPNSNFSGTSSFGANSYASFTQAVSPGPSSAQNQRLLSPPSSAKPPNTPFSPSSPSSAALFSPLSPTIGMLHPPPGPSSLIRAIKEGIGMGVPESGIVWAVSPWNCEDENEEVEEVDIEDMQGQVLGESDDSGSGTDGTGSKLARMVKTESGSDRFMQERRVRTLGGGGIVGVTPTITPVTGVFGFGGGGAPRSAMVSGGFPSGPPKSAYGSGFPKSAQRSAFSLNGNADDENALDDPGDSNGVGGTGRDFVMHGDVYFVKAKTMDSALFRVGGIGIALKLVGAAKTSHELSRALGVFTDGIKNSWQNSEDVERLRGYDILADILRSKAGMINMTSFETIFEFLGMNFRCPDQSTVTNPPAYLSLALDFELWSLTPSPIHQVFFEHFSILLETSRWRAFNLGIYKRIGKGNAGLVRRLLFVLKMGWFESSGNKNLKDSTSLTFLLDALKSAAKALWTKDEGIKPLVSYLAANLHDGYEDPKNSKEKEEGSGPNSRNREKAEQVLVILTSILRSPQSSLPSPSPNSSPAPFPSFSLANTSSPYPYLKLFLTNLPLTRILLLLLGPRPSPVIASQILTIIGICVSPSDGTGTGKEVGFVGFGRKFELVGGWGVLRAVLDVNKAAFDVMLGRVSMLDENGTRNTSEENVVTCPQMAPIILSAMSAGLGVVAKECFEVTDDTDEIQSTTESLIETLLSLHSSSPTFRFVFQSQQTTAVFVGAYRAFVEKIQEAISSNSSTSLRATPDSASDSKSRPKSMSLSYSRSLLSRSGSRSSIASFASLNAFNTPTSTKPDSQATINPQAIRILEKLSHFGLGLALDNSVAGGQKREILDILQSAEAIINPTAERTNIDPGLVQDTRSIRQRLASGSAGLSLLSLGTGTGMNRGNGLQFVGDRTVMKTLNRMYEWRKTIRESEKKRVRKEVLDLRETRRQISRLYDHTLTPTNFGERELWGKLIENRVGRSRLRRLWRLDETEGPHRIRKKLEPDNNTSDASNTSNPSGNNPSFSNARGTVAVDPEAEAGGSGTVDVPPWAESYEVSSTDMDDRQLAEEIAEDKHRRVRHELEPGDVIECVGTVARVAGVDSSPGLLILGRTHIYMLDGLVENSDGEVIEAHDAPKSLFFVPGSIVELDGPQRAHRWSHEQIATFGSKTFLFRDVALEIYFKDSRSLLVVFIDKQKRSEINQRLTNIVNPTSNHSQSVARTPLLGGIFSGLWTDADELSTAQRRWQAREISNFTYLCVLNQVSGRTPSDATQYPVFPWVLQDYTSSTLDLSNPQSFRDLTKPMGAQTPARQEAASTRYANLSSVDEKPFHYGTHFSSSMIVCHFLIRMAPFTNMFKTLQGGDWDLPDRLFSDISRAYESAARDIRGDVRELIPEFFNLPEFLENSSDLDFGVQQNTGERIHDVKLPPWAKQDPLLFIIMNRRALESPHVSENLPAWIDLIWGYKQRDPASLNVFHPLSYEGSIDLDSITDELEREATVGIIHNFGQTPRKLFTTPHPQRYNHGLHTLPIGTLHGIEEDAHLLVQGSRCIKDLGPATPITALALDMVGEKILPCPPGVLYVPAHPHEQISWTPSHTGTKEIRVSVDSKVVQIIEGSLCSCAAFADANVLVTGSSDWSVRIWRLFRGGGGSTAVGGGGTPLSISQAHIMRIHTDEVVSVAACRAWSVIVSGSRDGSAALWDLNRAVYVRSIWHDRRGGEMAMVSLIDINESTGYIATCSHQKLCLHTINARPIAVLDLTTLPNYTALRPPITSMGFHEREYSHLGVLATGGSDGIITLRTWSVDNTPEGEKARWEFVTLRAMKVRAPVGRGIAPSPAVTALKFLGESLCHGEETGKSYVWSLPD